jgi:hypothetical protein
LEEGIEQKMRSRLVQPKNQTLILKPTLFSLVLLLLANCSSQQQIIDKPTEEGVEVILNHLEPYAIKGVSSRLILEKDFSIDTENEKLAQTGLTEMETFDVDREGNIYIIRWQSNENYIFKFNRAGNFVTSFLRRGQGPGELEWGGTVLIDHQGNLLTKDPSKPKFSTYDRNGRFIKEVILKKQIEPIAALSNGKYFYFEQIQNPDKLQNFLGVSDSTFDLFQLIYQKDTPNPFRSSEARVMISGRSLIWGAGKSRLYIGDNDKGYEIRVYNLEGKLQRKIRKEYKPVPVSEEFKQKFLERFPEGDPLRGRFDFPAAWPAFMSFIEDEDGRLLVRTFEKGLNPDENMFDIFSQEGVFIGRASIANRDAQREQYPLPCICRGGRLYSVHDKESGYRELSVCRMRWE